MIEDSQVVKLHAPKGSATLKSSERGIGVAVHKFSFTQVCIGAGLNSDSNKIADQTPYYYWKIIVSLAENSNLMYQDFSFLVCLRILPIGPFFFLLNVFRYLERTRHKMTFMWTR